MQRDMQIYNVQKTVSNSIYIQSEILRQFDNIPDYNGLANTCVV